MRCLALEQLCVKLETMNIPRQTAAGLLLHITVTLMTFRKLQSPLFAETTTATSSSNTDPAGQQGKRNAQLPLSTRHW
jgi:hypothetical protein